MRTAEKVTIGIGLGLVALIAAIVILFAVTGGNPIPPSAGACARAEVQFWASVDAKETLHDEGRLTADLREFHNDQIITAGEVLKRCGRL